MNKDTCRSLANAFIGTEINEGWSRTVYTCPLREDYVVKVAREDNLAEGVMANAQEFKLYETLLQFVREGGESRRWQLDLLAEILWISSDCRVLIMKKAEPCPEHLLPKVVPRWAQDLKKSNMGIIDGKVVFVDYAEHSVLEAGLYNKVKLAHWG